MIQKRSVGLVGIVEVPGMGRVAVLQRRGEFNHEKLGQESWPGGCQVTVHGGVEENETSERALVREITEELGEDFLDCLGIGDILGAEKVMCSEKGREEVTTYALKLSVEALCRIRLGPSSGGLVLLPESRLQEVRWLSEFSKSEGVTDRRVIAMFPDEKEAVSLAFAAVK